ncbi:unannotated protein [freshwater metagenome]|uniref:Unannotated protein n=1 Tax=freshwater metagenome TaxID=449393 RepID=A0A6J7G4U1_9ZZZZ
MSSTKCTQLKPVFQHPQESITLGESRRLISTHVAARHECLQRLDGAAKPHGFVLQSVHELQKLNRELYVAKSPRAELDLNVDFCRRNIVRHPFAHALHLVNEALPSGRAPHFGRNLVDVLLAQLTISGNRTCFQECLKFPILGPAVVVGKVRFQRANECTGLSLRAKVGIYLPQAGLASGLLDSPG